MSARHRRAGRLVHRWVKLALKLLRRPFFV
jgi:hypothetical protein